MGRGVSREPWKCLRNLWTIPKVRWLCQQISNFVIWISPRKWFNSPSHSPPSITLALTRWHMSLKSKHPLFRIWFKLSVVVEFTFYAFLSCRGLLIYCTGDDKWGSEWCKSIRHQVHHNSVFLRFWVAHLNFSSIFMKYIWCRIIYLATIFLLDCESVFNLHYSQPGEGWSTLKDSWSAWAW